MQEQRVAQAVKKLKSVLSPRVLRNLGASSGLVRRSRCVTAERLVPSLLRSLGSRPVSSLAELARDFNSDHETAVFYKPFYERLDSDGFACLMREVFSTMLANLHTPALEAFQDGPFSGFDDIWIQDGTSFALHPALASDFPGRFTDKSPAAVELHCTMSLFQDRMVAMTLSPDTSCERHYLPNPADLAGKLMLADRGYDSSQYFEEVDSAGGSYVVRMRKSGNPKVVTIHARGKKFRNLEGRLLSEVLRKSPRTAVLDMDICWEKNGTIERPARFVATYNARDKHWVRMMTNLSRGSVTTEDVLRVYRLRWQIELLFKELKSHANLHSFVTRKRAIAEGLIWGSLAAAVFKRFVAYSCQFACGEVDISTRRTAMCTSVVFGSFFTLLCSGRQILTAIRDVFRYLVHNALRSNPKRDRTSGRLQLGLRLATGNA